MTFSDTAGDRVFSEIKRICYAGLDSATLRERVVERLRSVVPFEAYAAFTMDPLSGLPTGYVDDQVVLLNEEEVHLVYERTFFEDHLPLFTRMAKGQTPVKLVSEMTGGRLERAEMHREVLIPKGFGDEVRGAFTAGKGELWGALLASRAKGDREFDGREVELVRRISPHVGAGLRAAMLRDQALNELDVGDASGVLVLDDRGRVVQSTANAARWLRELDPLTLEPEVGTDVLPLAVWTLLGALRHALSPQTERDLDGVPQLCVLGRSGRLLTLEASLSEPYPDRPTETIVVISPAGPKEMLKLQTAAYGLSAREKEVLDLIVRGYPTRLISEVLHVSESTVQGHLSHVFEKVGVRSRRELLKRLFFDNFLPGS